MEPIKYTHTITLMKCHGLIPIVTLQLTKEDAINVLNKALKEYEGCWYRLRTLQALKFAKKNEIISEGVFAPELLDDIESSKEEWGFDK